MPLSERQSEILGAAGRTPDAVVRQQAVTITLGTSAEDRPEAQELLARGYLDQMQPSFHLIPRGEAMASEQAFVTAYEALGHGPRNSASRRRLIEDLALAATAVMERRILNVPDSAIEHFHSKLDKRDTTRGWRSVAEDAGGVPYSALLYQRYVGGAWRQVQDAHSEIKGDALLEHPLSALLQAHDIPHYRTESGATGAARAVERYRISPAPDFLIPDENPTLAVEAKVGEDGGTVRDKAARIQSMARSAEALGLRPCAVIDGRGWSERVTALVDVVLATQGRTYTLATLEQLLALPEVAAL